jgi:hypothetical protein
MIPTLGGRGEARSRNGRSVRRPPKKGDPGSRTAPETLRPKNLGSSSKCHGGRGTAAKPRNVRAGGDPAWAAASNSRRIARVQL